MLTRYPLWKNILIVFVLVLGIIYSLPNLYPDDPVLQISGAEAGISVDHALLEQSKAILRESKMTDKGEELQKNSLLLRFASTEDQLKAKEILEKSLGDHYLVVLNLAPTTPQWLRALGASPMNLGLDLRGGVHFLMEVDMAKALEHRYQALSSDIRNKMREHKIYYARIAYQAGQGIIAEYRSPELREQAIQLLHKEDPQLIIEQDASAESYSIRMHFNEFELKKIQEYAISQNLTTLRNRVNELGVAEPLVQRQGANRIVIELPGVQDTAVAKRILGRTASLEFRMVAQDHGSDSEGVGGGESFAFKDGSRRTVLERKLIVTGDQVVDAQSGFDETGQPQVSISLDGKGGNAMFNTTRKRVGDPMAVLFVETKTKLIDSMVEGKLVKVPQPTEEKYLINVATVRDALSSSFRITGLDSPAESSELALLLRAGALAAPMYFVEEHTLGPSLGKKNIQDGFNSALAGFILVVLFLITYYRWFGVFASVALLGNLIILIAVMSLIPGATLTLPGMAGIALTIGMAVDANVLINERIREELRIGTAPHLAIDAGYKRAFVTILDANLAALAVAIILFTLGSGPVKGFAVTLSIGILASMFTAVTGTRAIVNLVYAGRPLDTLKV